MKDFLNYHWVMENKYLTLQVIYEMVKNDIKPTSTNILPNEIISRQHFPWDEIVNHLTQLHNEEYIVMKQSSPSIVTITEKGFQFIADLQAVDKV